MVRGGRQWPNPGKEITFFFCVADKPKLASDSGSEKERSGAPLVSTYKRSLAGWTSEWSHLGADPAPASTENTGNPSGKIRQVSRLGWQSKSCFNSVITEPQVGRDHIFLKYPHCSPSKWKSPSLEVKNVWMWHWGCGFMVKMVVLGWGLDWRILKVFPDLKNSMILWKGPEPCVILPYELPFSSDHCWEKEMMLQRN